METRVEPGVQTAREAQPDRRIPRELLVTMWILSFGSALALLNTTIVTVGIDRLAALFAAPLPTIQWVSTAYLLAIAVAIPITGWAMDRFGSKRLWIAALLLYLAGSLLAGLAWSAGSLIAARAVQGLGGGILEPVMLAVLARSAAPHLLTKVLSLAQIPIVLAPLLGPVAGGAILDRLSWHWLFLVNLPIGVLALVLARRGIPGDRPAATGAQPRLDVRGLALLSPALAALVYGLSQAGTGGGLGTPGTLAPLVIGAALLLAYVLHALRIRTEPLIDVRMFANHRFSAAGVSAFLFGAAIYGSMFLLPLYWQQARGQDAMGAGLLMAPQGLGGILVLPAVGWLTHRFGARAVVGGGAVLATLTTAVYTQLTADTPAALLTAVLLLRGVGMGTILSPVLGAAYQALGGTDTGRASSALMVLVQLGGSVGTALLAVVLQQQLTSHLGTASGHAGVVADPALATPLANAFGQTFWWAAGLSVLGMLVALRLPGRERDPAAPPAH